MARLVPEADVPSGQGCCGALHAHNGGSVVAAQMARRLGATLPGTIVSTAGGCAAYLAHELGHERVKEISEFLLAWWAADPATAPTLRPLLVDGRLARIALKDSCQLRNGLGVTGPPRELLGRIGEYVELPASGVCCGGAGTYSMLQPRMSKTVLDPMLQQARDAGVDYIVSLNVVCTRQVRQGARRARLPVRVLHLVEVLEMALD